MKRHTCKALILKHFNPSKQCFFETNFSDYINAGVLSQIDKDGLLHSITYFLRRMALAECNYEIYNKELLAIICCFKEWRSELEGTGMLVQILTDHKGLEYFMIIKKLTSRQTQWVEFLSEFNFVISYQNGKKNDKADVPIQKPKDYFTDKKDE